MTTSRSSDMTCDWGEELSPCGGQLHWDEFLDCCYCDRHEDEMRDEASALHDDLYPEERFVGIPRAGQ